MTFPRYADYKDSGVEWLGEVPAHWEVVSIKRLSPVLRGASPRPIENPKYFDDNGIYGWVRISDVSSSNGYLRETPDILSELGASLSVKIEPGTLFISIAGSVGKPCISARKICIHDGFVYFPLLNMNPIFIFRIFETGECYAGLGKMGTQLNLNTDTIGSIKIAAPPPSEIEIIAAFLDHETGKIDALVAEQEKLIALLKEKRQSVISHAVTKGLDPSVPLKDSGIEWLGEVPEHWDHVQLGRLCRQISDGPHFSPKYIEDGVMFLSARNIRVDGWFLDDAKYISEDDYKDFCKRVIPEKGDVLYTKGGTTGIARVVDLQERFQIWVHVAVLKIYPELVHPYFLAYTLNSMGCYEQSQLHTRGATNQDLGLTRMTKIWLPLPPLPEQTAIVAYLDAQTAKFDALTAEAERAIALLKERRSALISAAVTGKIDVRGFVAPTPQEAA